MLTAHILYFNGLGRGRARKRELLAIRYLSRHGIAVTHAPIDWYASETFDSLLERMCVLTKKELGTHGKLILVGSSAGGSLAINILDRLHDPNLQVVTLCSRLNEQALPWWDRRTLARLAGLNSHRSPSQAFFDSVTYSTTTVVPRLSENDKRHIIITRQWADFVVPRGTMGIPGVSVYRVPGLGHGWGIAMSVRRLPKIITQLPSF